MLSCLPYFISLSTPATSSNFLGFLLSLVPVFRFVKLSRVSADAQLLGIAFRMAWRPLLLPLYMLLALTCFFGGALFFIETALRSEYSGDVTYTSMLDSAWYSVAAVTTVGYGGSLPQTGLGRLFSSVMMILSVGFVSIAYVIIGVRFADVWENKNRYLVIEKMKNRLDYNNTTIAAVKEIFDFCDLDSSGRIDIKEFEQLLNTEFRLGLSNYELLLLFEKICGDDQLTDFVEFCKFFFPDKTFTMRLKSFEIPGKQKLAVSKQVEDIEIPDSPEKMIEFQTSQDCLNYLIATIEKINAQVKVIRPALKALAADYEFGSN